MIGLKAAKMLRDGKDQIHFQYKLGNMKEEAKDDNEESGMSDNEYISEAKSWNKRQRKKILTENLVTHTLTIHILMV